MIVRCADDSVLGFESKADVDQFLEELKVRFAQFGLTLNEDKTRVLQFGRFAAQARAKQGLPKPLTFDFLGFTHICGQSWSNGWVQLKRLTSAKRMRARLKAIRLALTRRMHKAIPEVAVGCGESSRATSTTTAYRAILTAWTRSARTCPVHGCMRFGGGVSVDGCPGHGSQCWSIATFRRHGYSLRIRINASRHDSRQEPYAVVPHVRICAGGAGSNPRPYRDP